jgi:hypothetical protein
LRSAFEVGFPRDGLVASSPGGPRDHERGLDLSLG